MSNRSIVHASFTITRIWNASPARVFEAFANEQAKDKWFSGPGDGLGVAQFRFSRRRHRNWRGVESGMVTRFDMRLSTTVAEARIIYTYNMFVDDRKISVSQAAIEQHPKRKGTKFVLTKYGDYLDGYDDAGSREHGPTC